MIDYKNVLFCTDFSEDANIAFLHALDMAKKYNAKLHVLHVPHSSYAYCRHIVDEHVPKGAEGGEAFYKEEVEKAAEAALKKEYEKKFPSAIHIDGTSRPQFVEEKDNPNFYRVIKEIF